ncbi:MAG: metalloregulator ArsR/SmtB family transcription factor [Clostridiales bacterium]|nr:metalloregulator ArsR/SmtB family transcription factor [Clostridiales bacterium]
MIDTINVLNGLANEHRLRLFLVLLERDFCVCELQEILDMEQSRLSHQLRLLKFYGLVEAKQEGRWIVYSVSEEVRKNPVIEAIRSSTELSPSMKGKITQVRIRGIRENQEANSRREKHE